MLLLGALRDLFYTSMQEVKTNGFNARTNVVSQVDLLR